MHCYCVLGIVVSTKQPSLVALQAGDSGIGGLSYSHAIFTKDHGNDVDSSRNCAIAYTNVHSGTRAVITI